MKTQPNDVVVGGSYQGFGRERVVVTAVKPKGRGWYVEFRSHAVFGDDAPHERMALETFRRMARINQQEAA